MHAEDLLLARQSLEGDERARQELEARLRCIRCFLRARNRRHAHPLRSFDLDDVHQEAWMAIWKALPRFKGESKLESWAYRICMRTLARFRHARREKLLSMDGIDVPGDATSASLAEDEGKMERILRLLSEQQAAVLRLRFKLGLAFRDIAVELDISIPSAKTYYRRGIRILSEYVPPEEAR